MRSIRETLSKGYLAVPSRIIWERMSPSDDPLSDYRLTTLTNVTSEIPSVCCYVESTSLGFMQRGTDRR
jgi:hypothetical protein